MERWNYRRIQEKTNTAEIPEGISLTDATDSILSIASALGVTMERRPVFISAMTQADWQAETAQRWRGALRRMNALFRIGRRKMKAFN
ncbi:MAG: hypothetical protein ACLUMK_12675 [Christensenellales bacterium]